MSDVVRFSVSLDGALLAQFDRYQRKGRYATRSAAICQLTGRPPGRASASFSAGASRP